ncbi:Protein of unknown function UPF0301 [Dillenia turbinata]|uniref:Thioredoxin domain-containing protein n=1 Tax=Dillenia turbinata TaxID=194707 RepID=A0AAN8UVA4_9MAGN
MKEFVSAIAVCLVIPLSLSGLGLGLGLSSAAANGEFADEQRAWQWQMLTKSNFSSEIRLHRHILLILTLPCPYSIDSKLASFQSRSGSGESRTLMKELAHHVSQKGSRYRSLKLMFIYKNREKMLADALGATDGITIVYYQDSLSYMYRGRLRAQNILASISTISSVSPKDLPLRRLNSPEDLKLFLESADKVVLLLEFCGWAPTMLTKLEEDATAYGFNIQASAKGRGFFRQESTQETNQTIKSRANKIEKVAGTFLTRWNVRMTQNDRLQCGIEHGFGGVPWLKEFSAANESSVLEDHHGGRDSGLSCSDQRFQRFESFFSKFIADAREYYLPLERQRFALVSDRSLLPYLGVESSSSWSLMLYFAGCPICSKLFEEPEDMRSLLQMHSPLITELGGDRSDLDLAIPADKPSVVLFVDRSSESAKIRRSEEALQAFRELALHTHIAGQKNRSQEIFSVHDYGIPESKSGHARTVVQKIPRKDKVSIMIINEDGPVALDNMAADLKGSSLKEVLAHLLERKNEAKLSLLAKEAGFQLLSQDLDVANTLASQPEVPSNKISMDLPAEGTVGSTGDFDEVKLLENGKLLTVEQKKNFDSADAKYASDDRIITTSRSSTQSMSMEHDKYHKDDKTDMLEDVNVEENVSLVADNLENQQHHFPVFQGSFFFSDGGYPLLKALSASSKIPNMIIIDPTSQRHYVFPEEKVLNYSSQADFLYGFVNGSIPPYQRSVSVVQSPREPVHPPFVNLDFHEADGIPRVSSSTFSELVSGYNDTDYDTQKVGHHWQKDILVLFTTNWCGFCQRMELVVREVYRAFKGYANLLRRGSREQETISGRGSAGDVILKFPEIYLMDCTLNDCSLILNLIGQRELYPALMLFPAERKNAVLYEGDMAVTAIFKFIADHGSTSHHLNGNKGLLWNEAERGGRDSDPLVDASPMSVQEKTWIAEDNHHEIIRKSRIPNGAVSYHHTRSQTSHGLHESVPHVVAGSILLATDKLLNAHPFDKSRILIVKAENNTRFEGLIINKHMSWATLNELEGLEILREAPLSFGGPVIRHQMPLVSLSRMFIQDQYPEVLPGVYFLDQTATIHEIEKLKSGNQSVSSLWFFLGYSVWGWEQLFEEIAEGAWNLMNDGSGSGLDWP